MGTIYLRYPDGQRTKRSEEEIRRLWSGGLMPSGTIYWQEGMSEWRPITEWLGDRPQTAPLMVQPALEAESYQFVVDPAALTKFLQGLLCADVAVACLALVVDLGELVRVQLGQLTPDQLASNDPVQVVIGLLQGGLGLVTGLVFLRWIDREDQTGHKTKSPLQQPNDNLHWIVACQLVRRQLAELHSNKFSEVDD